MPDRQYKREKEIPEEQRVKSSLLAVLDASVKNEDLIFFPQNQGNYDDRLESRFVYAV